MRKEFYFTLMLLGFIQIGLAQNTNHQFSLSFSSSGDDRGRAVAIDDLGNSYITGSFSNQMNVGGMSFNSFGGTDIFLTKLDVLGNVIWIKQIGGTGNDAGRDIVLDNLGNIIVVGYFNGTVDFDAGAGIFELNSYGLGDGFILKMNADGMLNYAGNVGGSEEDRVETVSYNPIGDDIAIGGWFSGVADISPNPESDLNFGSWLAYSHGEVDFFVSFLDNEYPNSSFFYGWARGGLSNDYVQEISYDNQGNLVVVGDFSDNVNFSEIGISLYGGGLSGFIAKFEWDGDPFWVKNIILSGTMNGVCVRPDNSIVCSGSYFNGIFEYSNLNQFGIEQGGQYMELPSTSYDSFIASFSSSGEFLNFNNFTCDGYDFIYSVTGDSQGNSYIGGHFESTIDVDGVSFTSAGQGDMIVAKLNYSLERIWAKSVGGVSEDYIWDIKLFPNEDIGLVSNFQASNVDFDPNSSTAVLSSLGGYDGAYSKWCNISTPVITPDGPTTFCQNQQVGLSASGFSDYEWSNSLTSSNIVVTQAGNYSVLVTNSTGCKQSSESLTVVVNPLPNVSCSANPSNSICEGTSVSLIGSGANVYDWNNGISNNVPFTVSNSSMYSVIGTDLNGCQNTATIDLSVIPNPEISTSILGNILTVSTNDNCSFQWYNCNSEIQVGQTSETFLGQLNQEYYVQATSPEGCFTNSDCLLVLSVDKREVEEFIIYPNPSNGNLTLNNIDQFPIRILLYDISGKLVCDQVLIGKQLDISNLESGSYMISIPELGLNRSVIKL
jgi:hypothetical protein